MSSGRSSSSPSSLPKTSPRSAHELLRAHPRRAPPLSVTDRRASRVRPAESTDHVPRGVRRCRERSRANASPCSRISDRSERATFTRPRWSCSFFAAAPAAAQELAMLGLIAPPTDSWSSRARSPARERPRATLRRRSRRDLSAPGELIARADGKVYEHELRGGAGRCLGEAHGDECVRPLVCAARFG